MSRFELRESDYGFNASLDPYLVLKRMGFTESSIYQEGAIVRVHCPIHKDLVRKSLIVDTTEKTFKCQYSQCEAYEGGLLIELVALYYDCGLDEVTRNLFGEEDKSSDLLFRGEMFINKGMHHDALPYLEQAVSLDPRNEITRSKLAALLLELGRKDDAYREYLQAAESYAVRGELDKTLSIYNILIILQPGAVKARKELAYLFARMGRPDAAAEQLKWVVDFYMQYNQVRGAQESINSMLELAPDNGMCHYLLALLHEKAGKRVPAMQAYEKAIKMFLDTEEINRAEGALAQAIELAPANPRLKELSEQIEEKAAEIAAREPEEQEGSGGSEEEQFIDWLRGVDEKLAMGVDEEEAVSGAVSREAVPKQGGRQEPVQAEPVNPYDTSEISPEDRRVLLCLNDMKDLTPEQLEKMRQQLIGMFTEVRKTYEDGLLSDWEMRTIKDFYKAFCVAVDQHRRAESTA
ncbi:hypothetical protein KQI84_12645 [bacterium]|nr:hypothetical protein [bacterium]